LLVFAREQTCCLPPPLTALLPAGEPLLRFGELLLHLPVVMGILHRRTVCRHQKHPQSHVYASLAPYLWQRLGAYLDTGERHVPAIGFLEEGDVLGDAGQWATPPHCDAANLGQDEIAVVQPRAPLSADLGIGEAVVTAAAMEARIPWLLFCHHPT